MLVALISDAFSDAENMATCRHKGSNDGGNDEDGGQQ